MLKSNNELNTVKPIIKAFQNRYLSTMKLRVFGAIVLAITLAGCSKVWYDRDYKGESNFANFYMVDTIQIEDPVRIYSHKFGGPFVISRKLLKDYTGKIDFFSRPDVFILDDNPYRYLSLEDFKRYFYPKEYGNCRFIYSKEVIKDLEIAEFENTPVGFLMGLVNANFYYRKSNSYTSFAYGEKNEKKSYYKLVFPLCDN